MERYIEISKLPNFEVTCSNGEKYILLPYEHLFDIPEADVVPRAIIAEIFGEIEKNECHDISGKTTMYMLFAEELADLKKKYTGEE